mmetsp:Transcript_9496/g.34554  ORF Transcript_9496/g.34554 Transcript_9496/m.34554 type:complete len:272 (-) Transcript_9496:239-1054(-)
MTHRLQSGRSNLEHHVAALDAVVLAKVNGQLPQLLRRVLTPRLRRRRVRAEPRERPRQERHPEVVRQLLRRLEQLAHLDRKRHVQRALFDVLPRRARHARHRALLGVQRQRARDGAEDDVIVPPHVGRDEPRVRGDEPHVVVRVRDVQPSLRLHRRREARELRRRVVPLRLRRALDEEVVLVRREPRRDGGQRDDARALRRHQRRHEERREHEVAEVVRPHADLVPLLRRRRALVRARGVQPRVVDEDVQGLVLLEERRRERGDAVRVGQV